MGNSSPFTLVDGGFTFAGDPDDFLGRMISFLAHGFDVPESHYAPSSITLTPAQAGASYVGKLNSFESACWAMSVTLDEDMAASLNDMDARAYTHLVNVCQTSDDRVDAHKVISEWHHNNREMVGQYYRTQACYTAAASTVKSAFEWSTRSRFDLFPPSKQLRAHRGFTLYCYES